MARMNCICGEVLSNSAAPNDVEIRAYTDREWDSILEKGAFEAWKIPLPIYDVWRCTQCEEIYVFKGKADEEGRRKAIKIYSLEVNNGENGM